MDLDIVVCHTNLNIDQSKLIRPVFWLSGFVIWLTWWWMPLFLFLLHPTFYFLLLPPSPPCSLSPPLLFLLHPIPLSVVVLSQLGCGLEGSGPSLPSPRLQQQHQPQIQVMQQLWPHPPIDMCISDWPLTSQTLTPLSTDHWRPCEFKIDLLIGLFHPKKENFVIYSPSCRSKPIRNRSSSEHKWRYFWSNHRYFCPFSESRFTQNSSKCF